MGNLHSLDSPRPRFEGSHHFPPYSILCNSPPHLHPNGSFSWDSQSGVPKLFRFRLPGLWTLIAPRPKLGSGQSLNQSCSSPRELSNGVSHFTCTHRNRVDSDFWWSGVKLPVWLPALLSTITCAAYVQMAMRGHFGHLHFKTFPTVPIMPQCKVFWPLQSCSKFLGVMEDSQVPFSRVWVTTSQLPQSGVATRSLESNWSKVYVSCERCTILANLVYSMIIKVMVIVKTLDNT